jgi:hypothetical protein
MGCKSDIDAHGSGRGRLVVAIEIECIKLFSRYRLPFLVETLSLLYILPLALCVSHGYMQLSFSFHICSRIDEDSSSTLVC